MPLDAGLSNYFLDRTPEAKTDKLDYIKINHKIYSKDGEKKNQKLGEDISIL